MANITRLFGLRENPELDQINFFMAGIECEIESVEPDQSFENFVSTHDGSLRNDGMEFISKPLDRGSLLSSFKNLHADIQLYDEDMAFTSRTSTHVHINCRNLTAGQTRQLVLFYALFEDFFFAMVNKDRRGNIHCVPLTETFLPSIYKYDLTRYLKNWHKYTALNVLPLGKQGSIEFRHLQGTRDDQLLSAWLMTLDNLWRLCQREEITPEALADEAKLKHWWNTLFGHSPSIMALEPAFNNIIQNSLLDVKFAFI
jgi:Putative amidoligase enzyme